MLPSFCRVTGNSRNLPKPNYFPLLPPISPVEARRICRLMGKSVGSSDEELRHTYVPLIEFARISRAVKCHITNHADEQHHYQQTAGTGVNGPAEKCRITAKHQINESYKYLYPIIGAKDTNLKQLKSILDRMSSRLDTLTFQPGQRFVYQLDDNHLSLVLPADMEAAIRRGEIENLLLSKDGSSVLIRLKDGPSLTLNLRPMTLPVPGDMPPLLEGGGQDDEILAKQRQIRQYKKRKISDPKKNSATTPPEESDKSEQIIIADWTDRMEKLTAYHRSASNLLTLGSDWRELLYPKIDNWDFDSLPVLKEEDLPDLPIRNFDPIQLPANSLSPGLIQSNRVPILNEETVGFEAVPIFGEVIRPFKGKLPPNFVQELDRITATQASSSTSQLKDLFSDVESLMFLPFIHEVGSILEAVDGGRKGWMVRSEQDGVRFVTARPSGKDQDKIRAVEGMMVPVGQGEERFVVGQHVPKSTTGFVPGKIVGEHFQPGCVVQGVEGVGFLPGCTFDGVFAAGQILRDGKSPQFINGQSVQTLFGPKFLPGRTIQTDGEGLKFVAGQTSSVDGKFYVGQIFQTINGPTFVSGVTFDTPQGACFVAGQVDVDGQFAAGQVLMDGPNGRAEFTMGENVETADGPLFLAGQSYKTPDGRTRFCPGRQMVLEDGQKLFVPGETMISKEGSQFVAGVLAEEKFIPCQIDVTQNGRLLIATKEEEVFFRTGVSDGLPIDNSTLTAMPRKKPDMGYMIQVEEKVKFLPTEQGHDELMIGPANGEDVKVVPGQLMEMDDTPKFVPGKSIESALGSIFIPGQAVRTGPNKIEQFVPGQVIDTGTTTSVEGFTGPIFCPGQMVNCESGKKFVPGQVFGSKTGPRFVPGKILLSPSGASTFIPGQVLYSSDRGSVFVPGNIVDTNSGPYFVPGRVVDLPNGGIKFLAGEIIETDSGPRYVTEHETDLDLLDEAEDQKEIVVQGFAVTPEELRLITAYPFAALHYPLKDGDSIINSRMLRQMAAAGVAVSKLTNNPNANNNSGDVKVVAPKDVDESILGANVFRMTEPEPPKPKKPKAAPAILGEKLPVETKVMEAEPLKLAVKVGGEPPPDVKWFKDPPGTEVVPDERTSVTMSPEGMAELEINAADPQKDSGKYTMVAVNETGQVTSQTVVDVQKKHEEPKVVGDTLPADTKVMEDEPLTLKLKVGGNPLPDVKWYKDPPGHEVIPDERTRISLSPDGTAELAIDSANPATDAGQYKMVATNELGQLTAQTNVNVEKKPRKAAIEEALPAKVTTFQGQLLKLTAKVSGHPPPNVKWYKDPPGTEVTADDRTTIELLPDGSASLEIASVDPAKDSGQYKMVVMNGSGQATSQSVVEVSKKPMKATVEENLASSVIAYHGEPLKLKVKVSGNPLPNVKWFKDDKELTSDGRMAITLSPDGTAEFEIASADSTKDSGKYKMVAVNATGQSTSETTVDVQKNKPKKATIDENLSSSVTAYHGDPLKLKLKLSGFPLPEVKWFRNDDELKTDERMTMQVLPDGTAQLDILSADMAKDGGQYKMVAVNATGQVTSQTVVKIQKKPESPSLQGDKLPVETKVMEAEPLKLSVKLNGHPLPDVKWYKDPPGTEVVADDRTEIKLLPDGTAKLEIHSADPAVDCGKYKMVAINSLGEVTSETAVHVEKKPKKAAIEETLPAKVTTFQGQLLKLTAKVSGHPPPNVKWFKDPPGSELIADGRTTMELLADGTATLEIASVEPDRDSGQYRIVASNATGQAISRSAVEVSKQPMKATVDENLASSVIAYHGEPLKLKVKVSGNPLPSVKWYKDEKQLVANERMEIKLSADGMAEFEIASADWTKDSGQYKMVAVNATGQVTSETTVDVQQNKPQKASIDESLSALVTAYHGEPLKLKAKVSGHPLPDVKWYKGEKELKTNQRVTIKLSPDGVAEFEIHSADSAKDSGQYKMVAVNASGQITSQSIVDVQRNKPKKASIDEALSSSVTAYHGEPLNLKLKLSGYPLPEVKWFKDDKELVANERTKIKLSPDGTAELEIPSADVAKDCGQYKVIAVNAMGQVTSETAVDIQKKTEAPTIMGDKLSAEIKVMETEPLKLTLKVGGNPLPDVKWFKDPPGHELFPDERMTIKLSLDGTAELEIASADSTCDSGQYKMIAVNALGQSIAETKVNVEKKPKQATIDEELPPKVTAYQGQLLKLTAKVSGHPLPVVKWFKDPPGKELVNDERTTIRLLEDGTAELEITSVDPDKDTGAYRMVVINPLGEVSSKTAVHVSKKPKKATLDEALSSSVVAYHGEPLKLKLKVSGNPLPDVKWFKDDRELTSDDRMKISLSPDGTAELEIASADSARDSGQYKVTAVNATGQVTSETSVDVQKNKPKKVTIEENLASSLTVFHGEPMKLKLKLNGYPLPDVKWYKDDNELVADERIAINLSADGTAELDIPSADSAQDSGQYRLIAVNALGQITSQTIVDVQKSRPKEATIDEALASSLVVHHGQPLTLKLKLSGYPLPEVKWFKDGKELKANERMTIKLSTDGTAELEISSADSACDSGEYKVVAKNPMGQVTSQTVVDVQKKTEAPTLLSDKLPESTNVTEGDSLKLSVKVGGDPLPDVKWFKDGQGLVQNERTDIQLLQDGTAKLEITKTDPVKDAGEYKVVAKNSKGQVTSQTDVNIEKKTEAPTFLGDKLPEATKIIEGDSLKLSVKVGGDPLPDVKWFKDGQGLVQNERTDIQLLQDGTAKLEITNADPVKDAGIYKMVAKNTTGQITSQTTVNIEERQKEATIDEALPAKTMAFQGQMLKLTVKVGGNPLPDVKWYKDGTELTPNDRTAMRSLPDGTAQLEIVSADSATDSGQYQIVAENSMALVTSETAVRVTKKPKKATVDEQLSSTVTAYHGDPMKLKVKVSGNPLPEIKWYKDNEELIPDERLDIQLLPDGTAALEIASADSSKDGGLYKMVAVNPTGQSITQTTVDVKRYKPKLATIDEGLPPVVTAVQGQPLKLSGKVSGHPQPEVKWLKDGRLIHPANANMSHLADGTVSLEIKSARSADAGKYTLSVLNELGENECDTVVEIEALPVESPPPVPSDNMNDPLILDFFKRIKTDLESVENDPYIRETLEAAEALAQTGGRLDLAKTIRTLLDILKNTERDPEVVDLIFGILRSRQSKKPPSGLDSSALHGLLGRALTNKLGWAKSPAGTELAGSSVPTRPVDLRGLDGPHANQNGSKSPIDESKLVDKWQYLNGPVENNNNSGGRLRKISAERRHPRRVTSRSSSFARNMDLSEEASDDPDIDESGLGVNASPRVFDPSNPIPTVINSAKDISHYVIDTLRYSRDEAKKEYYTQKILEAVGLSYSGPRSSSNESEDGWKSSPASRKSSNNPSRKTSHNSPASACIILKDFLQTIVPAEAAHNVLIGQIDYMIIDDEGVRYFESAHGFASRRNSRYDIRLAAQETLKANRSRSGSVEPTNNAINEEAAAAQGPWPWADVGPRSRRASIDEFRKRLLEQDASISNKTRRSSSRERPPSGSFHSIHQPHGRHSVAAFPLSRNSSSGYVSPMASARSRRGSLAEDYCALYGLNAAGAANAALMRKRKVGTAGSMDGATSSISSSSTSRSKRFSQASFDESY
ncbi:MAM domain-containing glycosylphosphatidylinositol anchor protein 1 [Daphnia magna]|uniref:MAM domain-containing glycosylphosphatidylinositol anchor protein 1 n=1 Tax=Daphnia magna TaxID=35525 RepID=A0A0P5SRS9_9CRUS|nr:MAM domain-containing glycosylphosphatidylinositol anchor protein 1 [Daphnia magna]